MNNSCQGCKRYWNHLHGKVTCFVRRMSKSSRHCMVIPERFAKHFAGKMPRTVKLEGPNGILYDVGVTEHRNRKVIQSGWEVFVDANDIVQKDSLMFRYRGSSRFKVAVFDSSGCEKTVPCFGIGSSMSDQPITNSTGMSGSSSDRNTHSSMGQQSDGCQSESSGHCRKLAWTDAASSPSEDLPGEDSPYEHESSGSDDHTLPKMISTVRIKEEQCSDGRPKDKYVLSSRSNLADAQKEKIDKLLQDVQSRTLAFVAIMRKSNVQPPYPSLVNFLSSFSVHYNPL
ncbi:unnamed protein product [Triticum turgidum subsp. durum]|uniref:TF-B3 domain-containing protein n=1 Tax=Triticum turgidum subsp. durum TaxID=4567 RepID=A0A9R0SGS1_TRITD|nr:unnamed protein product [Triticum turgidum subsp. durum]